MADEIVKTVTIAGKDDTGKATTSASSNFAKMANDIDKTTVKSSTAVNAMAKLHHTTADQVAARIEETNKLVQGLGVSGQKAGSLLARHLNQTAAAAANTGKQAQKTGQQVQQAGMTGAAGIMAMLPPSVRVAAAIAKTASELYGVKKAIDYAADSYQEFAKSDAAMRSLRTSSGATRHEFEKIEQTLWSAKREAGITIEQATAATKELMQQTGMSIKEAAAFIPTIGTYAAGANADVTAFSEVFGTTMRNLKVPAEDANKVLEHLSYGIRTAGLDVNKLTNIMPPLTSAMADWGYAGEDGAARMTAFLVEAQKVTGDATRGVHLLANSFERLGDEQTGHQLGFPPGEYKRYLREQQALGEDVMGIQARLFKEAQDRPELWESIPIEQRKLMRQFIEVTDKMDGQIKKVKESTGGFAAGIDRLNSPLGKLETLVSDMKDLGDTLGAILEQLGASTFIGKISDEIKSFNEGLKLLLKLVQFKLEPKDLFPNWKNSPLKKLLDGKLTGADLRKTFEDAWAGTVAGPGGAGVSAAQVPERRQARDEAKAIADDLTARAKQAREAAQEVGLDPATKKERQARADLTDELVKEARAAQREAQTKLEQAEQMGKVEQLERERDAKRRQMDKLLEQYDEDRLKAQKMSYELPDTQHGMMIKAAYSVPGYSYDQANNRMVGPATSVPSVPATPASATTTAATEIMQQAAARSTYGSSADARVLKASYRPSGEDGGDGQAPATTLGGTPSSARAGPGGKGSGFGDGTTLAPPAQGRPKSGDGQTQPTTSSSGIPSQFSSDVAAMTAAGAKPKDIQDWLSSRGVDTSIATCGQFMATAVKEHGGTPPKNPMTASNWNNFGQEGYSSDPNAINIAVKQGTRVGDPGSHVTAVVPIKDAQGNITGYRGVGVNQGKGGLASAKGDFGRNIITSMDITKDVQSGKYKIRHQIPDQPQVPQGATPVGPQAPTGPQGPAGPSKLQGAQGGEDVAKQIGISGAEYDAYRQGMADIESKGGQYGIKGGSSGRFSGAYQFGATEIAETARRLGEAPPSREQFLADPKMQERYMSDYTALHHRQLMKHPAYAAMSPRERLNVLGYAHNQGVGNRAKGTGAMGFLDSGKAGRDAFGYDPQGYGKSIQRRLGQLDRGGKPGSQLAQPPAPTTGSQAAAPTTGSQAAAPGGGVAGEEGAGDSLRGAMRERETAPASTEDRQLNVNLNVNDNQVQFARSSMRRQADREVREARWNSYSDIGAA